MSPDKPTRPVMSTPLRVFIGISIVLHVALVGMIVVPSLLGLFRKQEEPVSDEQVMLMKQRAAEKIAQEAAREEVRKELAKALKEDIRRAAGDLAPATFESFWTNSLAALQTNIEASASELAMKNLSELTPADLEAAMRGLRETAIDALMAELGDQTKDEIAAQVLSGVAATLPEFNQKTRELMSQAESQKARGEVDKLLAEERARRQKELTAATTGLTQAQQQIDQAKTQSAAIGEDLARTLGENRKRADAAAKADASVEKALRAAAEAARQTAALDKDLAAKAAADESAAKSDARLKEAAGAQANVEKSLAGALAALQEAATQAGQAQAANAKAGFAAAAAAAKTANDAVKAASASLQGNDPAKAATASEKAASALADSARAVADSAKSLTTAAASTNAAVAKAAAAALTAASNATNLLDKAMANAQAVAAVSLQADAGRRAAQREASAARTGATEAQEAIRTALDGAARDLRGTAAPLADKAEKPVADALAAAARQTDAVVAGPVQRAKDLTAANSIAAALQSSAQSRAAISNLVNDLTRTRSELSSMIGGPTAEEVKSAGTARGSMDAIMKTLNTAQAHLAKAAAAADKGSETQTSRAIEQTAKDVRDTGETAVTHAADALTAKPADPQVPQSGPRPGRMEISIAQRDMVAATNRLSDLSRQIASEKNLLGGAAQRFESNFVETVDAALTEDPALREKTREFVRQALREKVATEFRAKAEDLVGKVLARKGMEKDESFVRRVGQQAADLLLTGSESNLLDNAFAEMMGQTAKQFGVKPDAVRRKLAAEDNADANETSGDEAEASGGTPKDGASKGKIKNRKKKGPETTGAQAAESAGDDTGMDAVGQALENSLAKSLKAGTQSALSVSAKSSLRLPGAESFGESQTDSLRQRMADARGGAMRSLSTGGRETLIAGMSDNLARLGQTLKAGVSSRRSRGFLENPSEYRKNLETVIQGREVKEVVLLAPSLTNAISVATAEIASNRPSLILVGSRRDRTQAPTNALVKAERTLAPPEFKTFAYGGAPFATNPPTIDGDLAEWAGVRPFALRGVIEKAHWSKPIPAAWETNRYIMVQWDYSGFYFAYQMVDDEDDTNIDRKNFWEGDCLELWFDLSNRRSDIRQEDQQQFWFWPLGSRREPGIMGGEMIMPGTRTELFRANNTAPEAPRMAMKRTANPRGYQVEIFMPVARLRKPNLTPGRIIAFDYSTDNGDNAYFWWTTELGKQASMTPSVWGDLVLLGSDAAITAVKPGKTAESLAAIIPGEPLGVRIADADMNTDPHVRNQIKVKFASSAGQALVGYLRETEVSSGVFEGSVDTVEVLPDEERDATNNALPVVAGGYVEVSYYDQARRYGERNYTAERRVPVGVPVMRMSAARKGGE